MNIYNNIDDKNVAEPVVVVRQAPPAGPHFSLLSSGKDIASVRIDTVVPNLMQCGVTYGRVEAALDVMATARQSWEDNELAASHARLYVILAGCYDFYLRMKSATTTKAVRDLLSQGLKKFLADRGLATSDGTHDMNRVVKAVFGADRRRVSAYAIALRHALVDGPVVQGVPTPVPPSELASWIVRKGGVEQARQSGKTSQGPTTKEKVQSAKAALNQDTPITKFTPDPRSMPYGMDDVDKNSLLIVTYLDTGELAVKGVVKNDAAVKAALAAYYSNNKDRIELSVAGASGPAGATGDASSIDIALSQVATA